MGIYSVSSGVYFCADGGTGGVVMKDKPKGLVIAETANSSRAEPSDSSDDFIITTVTFIRILLSNKVPTANSLCSIISEVLFV